MSTSHNKTPRRGVLLCTLHHGLSDRWYDARIKGIWEDTISTRIDDQISYTPCGTELHLIGDFFLPTIDRSPKYPRKCKYIVDLVGVVTPPGSDDSSSSSIGFFWHDLRCRIRKSKDDRITRHESDIFSRDDSWTRYSDEDIRSLESIL